MVDRPPPQRFRIVERGGRLEVIDGETGARPASAAERMAAHDAALGHAALRYDRSVDADLPSEPTAPAPSVSAAPARAAQPADAIRAALAQRAKPWGGEGAGRAELGVQSAAEAMARPNPGSVPAPRTAAAGSSGRSKMRPIVTGKWWDSKGPRTITLGELGRRRLTSGFVTALAVLSFALIVLLVVQPLLLLVAGFVLFRFGGAVLGPLGARLIDEAIKADR